MAQHSKEVEQKFTSGTMLNYTAVKWTYVKNPFP